MNQWVPWPPFGILYMAWDSLHGFGYTVLPGFERDSNKHGDQHRSLVFAYVCKNIEM